MGTSESSKMEKLENLKAPSPRNTRLKVKKKKKKIKCMTEFSKGK